MEYVAGESVSSVIDRQGRIAEHQALSIILKVSGAVAEAAGMGIIHRDIKPGNILISKWGVPKLTDFGIAKGVGDIQDTRIQRSLTIGVVGTPTYMSPEQVRGVRDLDFRADIYSLGATLYHMVVGDIPFRADTAQETMVRVVSGSPTPPRSLCPTLSEPTAAVICRMMAKDPDDRYAGFEELRTDLAAARDGAPASIGYREALALLRPAPQEEAEEPEELSLARVLAAAAGVAISGLAFIWLLRSCSGP